MLRLDTHWSGEKINSLADVNVDKQERNFARPETVYSECHIVSVTVVILAHAERRFPLEPVRTFDAIHMARRSFGRAPRFGDLRYPRGSCP